MVCVVYSFCLGKISHGVVDETLTLWWWVVEPSDVSQSCPGTAGIPTEFIRNGFGGESCPNEPLKDKPC